MPVSAVDTLTASNGEAADTTVSAATTGFAAAVQSQQKAVTPPPPPPPASSPDDRTPPVDDPNHPSPGSALQVAETLSKNWDSWKLHGGADFAHPPANASQEEKDTFSYINSNTTLFDAMINGNKGDFNKDALTKADVDKFVSDAKGDDKAGLGAQDSWNSVDGLNNDQKTELNKPADEARLLVANWHAWGLSSGVQSFDKPAADLPQAAKDTLNYIEQNPALLKAIGSGDNKSDVITEKDVENFVGKATDDAKAGAKSYTDFIKANPDATDSAKAIAQSAAIVRGNETLFSAGSTDPKRLVDGKLRASDLQSIAATSGFGGTLTSAASLWGQPGMFNQFDTGGMDPSNAKPDSIAVGSNITDWISKQAPKNDIQVASLISDAADRNMTAGVDLSQVDKSVFTDPGKFTAQQKAAVIQQLKDISTRIDAGTDASDWDSYTLGDAGINPNPDKVKADIQAKIGVLSADPDTAKFISDNRGPALQSIVGSDPALHDSLQKYFDGDVKSGKALSDSLALKDENGNPVTVETGLQSFVGTATVLSQALGSNGQPLPALDLQDIAQKSGKQDVLRTAYTNDILSSNELSDAINNGSDIGAAVQQFSSDAAAFGSTLPSQFVADNAPKLQAAFSDSLATAVLGNATQSDLNSGVADSKGNLDTAKLTDAVNQLQQQDPDMFKDSSGATIRPDQIVGIFAAVFADVRQGAKLSDSLAKLSQANADNWNKLFPNAPMSFTPDFSKPTGPLADAYNKGILHAVSAVFTGVITGVRSVGATSSPTLTASQIAGTAQVAGGLLEAGSKYAKDSKITPLSGDSLKGIESAGKAIGGAGGIIAGALGIFSGVQDLKDGNKAGAGVSLATGITGSWSGVLSTLEGGVGLADALGVELGVDAAALAATTATVGIIGAGVTALALTGLGIYALVEGVKRVDAFTNAVEPELSKWGITGGPTRSDDAPAEPAPPVEE